MPATASVEDFPLLVRLDKDWFDFSQAQPGGADIRFFTAEGKPLPYQIELWDAAEGTAAIWVRIPEIRGNARQEIKMHWGNPVPQTLPTARRYSTPRTGTRASGTWTSR